MRTYGYARVSTTEQHEDGAGLPAQVRALALEAERRGWEMTIVTEDTGASGAKVTTRPALVATLADLDRNGGVLVVTKLDRLSRSVADFSAIVERSRRYGWQLVVVDLGVDTTTAGGELVANMMVSVAQWERRIIGERTRAGMAERKRQGVHVGRSRTLPQDVVARIVTARAGGRSLAGIAADLMADGVPTAHGGQSWHASTVRAVLASSTAATLAAA